MDRVTQRLWRVAEEPVLSVGEGTPAGDACLQMLLGAFRPQTTTQDKKFPTGAEWRDLLFLSYFGLLLQ